jgi:serine protease Do
MIRNTLKYTQAATWAVDVMAASPVAVPTGTGFFVGENGLFATAWHVIEGTPAHAVSRVPHGDHRHVVTLEVKDLVFHDAASDFALLRTAPQPTAGPYELPVPLTISARELDEGEPVYAFGYPLPLIRDPLVLRVGDIRGSGFPLDEQIGPGGKPIGDLALSDDTRIGVPDYRLSPRTTSAIISSQIEYFNTIDPLQENSKRDFYVLDKALNYGNSGGPIIASETGYAHAICTRWQQVKIPQPQNRASVEIPSLYGIVTRLTHPVIRAALEDHGVVFDENA